MDRLNEKALEIRSVLITGANGGIGKEVARQLALRHGMEKIYLTCRNEQAAKQDLQQETKNPFSRSFFWTYPMSTQCDPRSNLCMGRLTVW